VKPALPWRSWLPEFVLLGMIWGSSFFFTRMATQAFGPWSTAWMRVMVAAITLVPFVLWHRLGQWLAAASPARHAVSVSLHRRS